MITRFLQIATISYRLNCKLRVWALFFGCGPMNDPGEKMQLSALSNCWHVDCSIELTMKVGLPYWQSRISPVLDVAGNLLVIEVERGREASRIEKRLFYQDPFSRAREISGLGVEVLICGALSWPLERALAAAGVRVIPHTCGPVEEIIKAFLNDGLGADSFLMPGCGGRERRLRRRRGWQG
jgi:predicted Fe-Mo cluster-binding NifX family protein